MSVVISANYNVIMASMKEKIANRDAMYNYLALISNTGFSMINRCLANCNKIPCPPCLTYTEKKLPCGHK
jgi:hypothetical protein